MGRKRIDLARDLRQQDIPAEERLWRILRNRALAGFKFRRQHPIGPYFADFAESLVIVEADGESHITREDKDAARTRFLEASKPPAGSFSASGTRRFTTTSKPSKK